MAKADVKKVKMTTRELVDSQNALDYISKHPLPGTITFRLGRIRWTIKPILDAFTEARNKLVEQYGTIDKETKKLEVLPGAKDWDKFTAEMDKIGDDVIEFESIQITTKELEEKPGLEDGKEPLPWLTGEVVGDLFWLIKE